MNCWQFADQFIDIFRREPCGIDKVRVVFDRGNKNSSPHKLVTWQQYNFCHELKLKLTLPYIQGGSIKKTHFRKRQMDYKNESVRANNQVIELSKTNFR